MQIKSKLGAAFAANKEAITEAITQAVKESAAKMGADASKLFSIRDWNLKKK